MNNSWNTWSGNSMCFLNCLKFKKIYKEAKQLFIMCYTVISSILHYLLFLFLRKIFITFMMILKLFFFSSSVRFWYLSWVFLAFCLFLLQKDFDVFRVLLFGVFLCVFDSSRFPFLYIEKKILLYVLRII